MMLLQFLQSLHVAVQVLAQPRLSLLQPLFKATRMRGRPILLPVGDAHRGLQRVRRRLQKLRLGAILRPIRLDLLATTLLP